MSLRACSTGLLLAALAAQADAQWTVGPAGSGADFEQITTAIAVVGAFDIVHVYPGSYDVFAVEKPITIVGAAVGGVEILRSAAAPTVTVSGIPPGTEVRLSGLSIVDSAAATQAASFVHVHDCAGAVTLVDVDVASDGPPGGPFPTVVADTTVRVVDSDQVALIDCRLVLPAVASSGHYGTVALTAQRSAVRLVDCELHGGDGTVINFFPGQSPGNSGLFAVDSTVEFARTNCRAGASGYGFSVDGPWISFDGAPGARLFASDLRVHGGPGNAIVGGDGYPGPLNQNSGGPAVSVDGASALRAGADAVLAVGTGHPQAAVPPLVEVAAGGSSTLEPFVLPTLAVVPPVAAAGGAVTLEVSTAPGTALTTWLALDVGNPLTLAGVDGAILLPLAAAFPLATLVAAGDGSAALAMTIPLSPGLLGTTLRLQAAGLVAGAVRVSNHGMLTVAL